MRTNPDYARIRPEPYFTAIPPAAIAAIVTLAAIVGCSRSTHLDAGKQKIANGAWSQAIPYLDEAIRASPRDGEAYQLRGVAHLRTGSPGTARKDLARARELDEFFDDPLAASEACLLDRAFREAEQHATRQIEKQPGAAVHLLRGRARLAQANWSEAAEDFRRASMLDPQSADAFRFLGVAESRQGRLAESEKCFTKSLSLVANDATTYWLRAEVRTKLEDLTGAESDRAIARELDPALGFAKSSVGESLLQSGTSGEADLAPIERLQSR